MSYFKNFLIILSFIFFQVINVHIAISNDHECDQCRDTIGESIHGSTGKWLRHDVPHREWRCIEIEDIGSADKECEMCEKENIRYVHLMEHNNYENLSVGCICAGHMEGDIAAAESRDAQLKSRIQRRGNWLNLNWKTSEKGNPYLKTRKNNYDSTAHIIAITTGRFGRFSASIDKQFLNKWYDTSNEAKLAAFDYLWPAKISN